MGGTSEPLDGIRKKVIFIFLDTFFIFYFAGRPFTNGIETSIRGFFFFFFVFVGVTGGRPPTSVFSVSYA